MRRAGIAKILVVALFFMMVVLPGRAVATDEGEEIGNLIIDLMVVYAGCEEYISKNPQGVCDSVSKVEHPDLEFDPSVFVSGNMKIGSGELVVKSPEGSATKTKLSIDVNNKVYVHSEEYGKVEMDEEEFAPYVEEAAEGAAMSDLKNAFTACMVHLVDNPRSTCDSLEVLNESGFSRLDRLVVFLSADIDASSGSIKLKSIITGKQYEIDYKGSIKKDPESSSYRARAHRAALTSDIKNAFTACMATIADDPSVTCDSLSRLESAGFILSDSVEFVSADIDLDSGSIVLRSTYDGAVIKINSMGEITKPE